MKLYEINEKIDELLERGFSEECIDIETGEIDTDKAQELLEQLQIDQSEKLENVACYIKNLEADIKAIKTEEANLKSRRESKEKKIESLKSYLTWAMQTANFTKFETPKIVLSFRKSESVEISDETLVPSEYMVIKTTSSPDKTAIKNALKVGEIIDGCALVEKQNIQIK